MNICADRFFVRAYVNFRGDEVTVWSGNWSLDRYRVTRVERRDGGVTIQVIDMQDAVEEGGGI